MIMFNLMLMLYLYNLLEKFLLSYTFLMLEKNIKSL